MGFLCPSYANAYSVTIHHNHNILSYSTSSSRALTYFYRQISKSRAVTNRQSQNLTVWLVQQQNHRLVHLTPLSSVNAGQSGGEWSGADGPNIETEVWDYFKRLKWEDLVLPAGFGIVVAVPAARQRAMLFFFLSLFTYVLVHKASAFQGGQSNSRATVSPKSLPYMLLTAKKFIASRGLILFVKFIAALHAGLRKTQMYISKFVAGVITFLVPIGQKHFKEERQVDGSPSKPLHYSVMVQHQGEKYFNRDLPPLNSSHTRDSSVRLAFDMEAGQLDLVLSDVKMCISKLEHMMAKEQSCSALGDMVSSKVRKTLDLLKDLNTDLSLMGDRHDLLHLQLKLAKENFKTKSDELLHFNTGQLHSPMDAAEKTTHEILKAISLMKETGEGDHSNIPAMREYESAALSVSASDSLSIYRGDNINKGIHEVTDVKGVSAEKFLAQEEAAGDVSFYQEAQGKDLLSHLTDTQAGFDSDGNLMFQSNPSQWQQSSNLGSEVSMRVGSPLLQSSSAFDTWKADRNQINGSFMSHNVQASVVDENNVVRSENTLPETLQDARNSWQQFDQDGLKSAFGTSTSSWTGNPSDSPGRNNEECNRSTSSSEVLITVDNEIQKGHVPRETILDEHKIKFLPDERQSGRDQADSISSASAGHISRGGILNGGSQGKEYNDISEHQGTSGRKIEVKRPQQARENAVFETDSHKDGSMNFVEPPDNDMKSGVKASGSRDGRNSYWKLGRIQNDDTDFGVVRGAPGETRHGSVNEKVTSSMSPTGFTGQLVAQQNSGGSKTSSSKKGDETFLSESTKQVGFMQEDQDFPHQRGLFSRKQKEQNKRIMDEGEAFFTKGKAGLSGKVEVGVAESMLYKAADLFASAAAIDPCSIEAVGFWGNTLLVHGELKLKLSRELRMMLPSADIPSLYQSMRRERLEKELAKEETERLAIQQTLQVVCEECEELLVEAGRKYRTALSINKSDVRALYNWGLALCFRAQLIAEGGEQNAAEDADKIYIAAIDKFEAMMGISQRYAPGAMLNWGLALRDRSRLRPRGSKDRIRLLQQAKQLFQDALQLNPNDAKIRGAFATCNVELKELQESETVQSRSRQRLKFGTS